MTYIAKSSNYYLKICTQLVLNGSRSPLANGINFICYKHNIRKYDLPEQIVRLNSGVENQIQQRGLQIRELIMMRDYMVMNF
jgi:hypothetical protein